MAQSEEATYRARTEQNLIRIRWFAIPALAAFYAYVAHPIALEGPAAQLFFGLTGAYLVLNVLMLMMLGRPERAGTEMTAAVSLLGLVTDLVAAAIFTYASPDSFRPLACALFTLPIFETAVLFSDISIVFVLIASCAAYGAAVKWGAPGEMYELVVPLIPQGFILSLVALFAWALHRTSEGRTKELSHTRQLTESVVEALPDGIVIFDGEMRILFINDAGAQMLGLKPDQILGIRLRSHVSAPIRNLANLLKVMAAASGDKERGEAQLDFPEEKILKVIRLPLRDVSGSEYGQMYVFSDVSGYVLLNKLKSDFISIAAHQLRTPLSSIKWAFSMLADGGLGPISEDQKPVVAQGLETSMRLVRLVNSLLNVSRIEEGRLKFEFKEADASGMVGEVLRTLQAKAAERQVRMEVSVPDMIAPIMADPEKLGLVLENVVDNAISYTASGGMIKIEAAPEEKFLRFTVTDNGVGIPASQQKLIFTKFFRGDNVIRMQTEGSGLGLYIAKSIIERHGGAMSLSSREGEGTTVSFTVPFAK
jgi:PAS domain S-box-containing protein